MINPAEKVGLKWAKRISTAFQDWAAQEKKSRTIKIKPFDPEPQLKLAFYDAGAGQLEEVGKLIGEGVKFDLRSPEAEKWISDYAADQIKYIDATNRQAIRQIKLRAQQEGLSLGEQANEIKQNIGLLPQHVVAVENYEKSLLDSGMDSDIADSMADKYAAKLLRYRANMIGRTEGMDAVNNGRRMSNEDAVDRGIIDPDEIQQEWVVSGLDNMCEHCKAMNGQQVPVGEPFETDEGEEIDCPPLHPHCTCGTVLAKVGA